VSAKGSTTPLLRLVVRRYGTTYVIALPPVPPDVAPAVDGCEATLAASWPFVQVTACTSAGDNVVWTSYDGARTWIVR
jgi:hypothetical protein